MDPLTYLPIFWLAITGAFELLSLHTWDVRKDIHNKLSSIRSLNEVGQVNFINFKPLEELLREIMFIEVIVFIISFAAAFVSILTAG